MANKHDMRGKYERSPGFRLLKTDSFAIMFFGFYHGLVESGHNPTLYGAAKMFCKKFEHCDLQESDMVNGHQRLSHIIKEMKL